MENNIALKDNEIYMVAKEISKQPDNDKKNYLYDKLEELIFKELNKKSDGTLIEKAIEMAANNQEPEIFDIIMDEGEEAITHFNGVGKNADKTSSMFIVSCLVVSNDKKIALPSISTIQETIQTHLLQANIISDKKQISVAPFFLEHENVKNFSIQDWWQQHHKLLDDFESPKLSDMYEQNYHMVINNAAEMFHLLISVNYNDEIDEKEFSHLMENVLDLNTQHSFVWKKISDTLSSDKVSFEFTPPKYTSQAVLNSDFIIQTAQLQILFNNYKNFDNIEVGYINTEEEDVKLIMIFDNEDNMLADFYVFNTDGDEEEFLNLMMDSVKEFYTQTLWFFDSSINTSVFNTWSEEQKVDLTQLLEHGHKMDFNQTKIAMNGHNSNYLH